MIKILSNLENINKVSTKIILLIKEYNFNFVTFSGDVGTGKTSLIRNLLQHFNIAHNEITSPTFNLLNIYRFNNNKNKTYISEGRIGDNSDGSPAGRQFKNTANKYNHQIKLDTELKLESKQAYKTYVSEGRIDDNSDGSFKNGDCIWHYDLYRLNTPTEIFNLDFDESLIQYLTLVEWPEIIHDYLPKNRIEIYIKINGTVRDYSMIAIVNNKKL